MVQIFKNTNYDFIKYKKIALAGSAIFLLISLIFGFIYGGLNFSIDFAGGTLVQLKFEKPVTDQLGKIRSAVNSLGFGSPEIKTIGAVENNEIQITVTKQADGSTVTDEIRSVIAKELPDNKAEMRRVEKVGPKIGSELKTNTIIAGILSLIAILIYVSFRFHLPFAVASTIPLFHDALVTLGVFVVLDREISLPFIAAILTIIGYSLNDTIVIFDRIRENMRGGLRGKDFPTLVNKSINQTLGRTIITSITTVVVVLALFILGSEAIKDFALALLVGISVGTYSTVYIASPVLLYWHSKKPIIK
ncbi:MAG: protein translocase subunit SecF [Chitinispirillaceae bacterium]|nr:protein translocase subunit SecF [Chitinispirillaceae bacterium]